MEAAARNSCGPALDIASEFELNEDFGYPYSVLLRDSIEAKLCLEFFDLLCPVSLTRSAVA